MSVLLHESGCEKLRHYGGGRCSPLVATTAIALKMQDSVNRFARYNRPVPPCAGFAAVQHHRAIGRACRSSQKRPACATTSFRLLAHSPASRSPNSSRVIGYSSNSQMRHPVPASCRHFCTSATLQTTPLVQRRRLPSCAETRSPLLTRNSKARQRNQERHFASRRDPLLQFPGHAKIVWSRRRRRARCGGRFSQFRYS
jgi:hypothetical protein